MKIEGDIVIFDSGKIKEANCGIIGISIDGEVTGGYDHGFWSQEGWYEVDSLTIDERMELADYMIKLWQQFKVDAES